MMSPLAVCRACLSSNVYVCPAPREYIDQFVSLTNLTIHESDGKPLGLCHICCHYIRKYHKFQKRCLKADDVLNQHNIIHCENSVDKDINLMGYRLTPELKCTPVRIVDLSYLVSQEHSNIPLNLEVKQEKNEMNYNDTEGKGEASKDILDVWDTEPLSNTLTMPVITNTYENLHEVWNDENVQEVWNDPLSYNFDIFHDECNENDFQNVQEVWKDFVAYNFDIFRDECTENDNQNVQEVWNDPLAYNFDIFQDECNKNDNQIVQADSKAPLANNFGIFHDECNESDNQNDQKVWKDPLAYNFDIFHDKCNENDNQNIQEVWREPLAYNLENMQDEFNESGSKMSLNTSMFPLKSLRVVLHRLDIVQQSKSPRGVRNEPNYKTTNKSVYFGREECTMDYAEKNCDQASIDGENEFDETGSPTNQLQLDPEKILTYLPSRSKIKKLREKWSSDVTCKRKIYSLFICDHCNRKFTSKVKLGHHIAEHLNTKNNTEKTHNKIHAEPKRYECTVCEKYFSLNKDLKRHLIIHTGDKPYQCLVCQKSFRYNQDLKRHFTIHTGDKPYQCPVCQISFSLIQNLKRHLIIHTGDKPYQCPVCNKCFCQNSDVKRHLIIHTGDKPYQCPVCQISFSLIQHLKRHLIIHTGDKPYQCPVCNKCFRQNSDVKRHLIIHTRDKPYQCPVCQISFSLIQNLKRHLIIHTGDKPYQCPVCNKCFRQNSDVKRHLIIHT